MSITELVSCSELRSIDQVLLRIERAHPNDEGPLAPLGEIALECKVAVRAPVRTLTGSAAFLAEATLVWARDVDDEEVARCELGFRLEYKFPPNCELTPALLAQFATQVATYNAWPFIRERLLTAATQAQLPIFVLPIKHLGQMKKKLVYR